MELLLIVPKYNLTNKANYNYTFPLGLAYISSAIKQAGYNLDTLNTNHFDGKIAKMLTNCLDSKNYDLVLTGNNSLGYEITETIIQAVRRHRLRPKVILGGPIVTAEPDLMFNALEPDFAVLGEGEETIVDLLNSLRRGKDMHHVKSIMFRNESGSLITTPPRGLVFDLDSLPFPDLEGLGFENWLENTYSNSNFSTNSLDNPRILPLLTSRSCPYSCTFCYHDSKYRKRSMDNILEEITLRIKSYNPNLILIYDECFAIDKERLFEFCNRIKKLSKVVGRKIKWTCQLRVPLVHRKTLSVMREAGCEIINYGFESFSPVILKSMKKYITPQQIDNALHLTMEAKIGIKGNFIFGDVAETKETAKVTLDYWKKNCKGQIMLNFVRPYPGSEIYQHCIERGIIKDKLDFIKNKMSFRSPPLNMTTEMTNEEFNELKKEIFEAKAIYNKFTGAVIRKSKRDAYAVKVECPYCRKINIYKNCLIYPHRFLYALDFHCRECNMSFYVVNPVTRWIYKHYKSIRPVYDYYCKVATSFRKKFI